MQMHTHTQTHTHVCPNTLLLNCDQLCFRMHTCTSAASSHHPSHYKIRITPCTHVHICTHKKSSMSTATRGGSAHRFNMPGWRTAEHCDQVSCRFRCVRGHIVWAPLLVSGLYVLCGRYNHSCEGSICVTHNTCVRVNYVWGGHFLGFSSRVRTA
jgi:hypothetical protein